MNSYIKYNNHSVKNPIHIKISEMCLESFPCQHTFYLNGVKQPFSDGVSIYKFLEKKNLLNEKISQHFLGYKDFKL